MTQCINLGIENADVEICCVLEIVCMEDNANIKFKSCSLGMKQRIGIAMALLGDPALLILDEPINGLDTDGMRIMREILVDITKKYGCTVFISSHILGKLETVGKSRTITASHKMMNDNIEACGGIDFTMLVVITYAGNLSDRIVQKYLDDSAHIYQNHIDELRIGQLGCVIGTHTGPGAIVVSFVPKE